MKAYYSKLPIAIHTTTLSIQAFLMTFDLSSDQEYDSDEADVTPV